MSVECESTFQLIIPMMTMHVIVVKLMGINFFGIIITILFVHTMWRGSCIIPADALTKIPFI